VRYSKRKRRFAPRRPARRRSASANVDDAPRRGLLRRGAEARRDDACDRVVLRTHKYTVKLPFNGHGGEGVKDEFPGTRPGSRSASALSAAGRRLLVCYWTLAAFLALDQHCQHALQPAADTSHDAKTSPSLRSAASRASVRRTSST